MNSMKATRTARVERHPKEPRPNGDQCAKHQRAAAPDPGQIAPGHRQNVAEQVRHQIDPERLHEAQDDQPKRQRGMGKNAEDSIGGQAAAQLQQHQRDCEQKADCYRREGEIEREQSAGADA
jgi:hypothetical protein